MKELPIEIRIENSRKELVEFINEISNKYSLSYYFLYIIINEIYEKVKEGKRMELENFSKGELDNNG